MRVELTRDFERAFHALSNERQVAAERVIRGLPQVLGNPHAHRGTGVRKLHPSGIWEARVGLGLRLIFAVRDDVLTLCRLGSHDEIRRFLEGL